MPKVQLFERHLLAALMVDRQKSARLGAAADLAQELVALGEARRGVRSGCDVI